MTKTMQFQEIAKEIGMDEPNNPIATIPELRPEIMRSLEIRNRQQFVRRYQWTTLSGGPLPQGFDPDIVERILYYRYNLICFVYDVGNGPELFTTPYALNGTIDVYGRYRKVSPLTFNGSISTVEDRTTGDKWEEMNDGEWITDLELVPSYSIYDTEQQNGLDRCVILQDYTNGIAQKEVNRHVLSQTYNALLADIVALIRHNLVASARVFSYRVLDEGQKRTSLAELEDMESEILENGKMFFPVTSSIGIDTVFEDKELDTQSYWECFVSLDNLRENLMGIENNGIFKKKERELSGEAEKEGSQADLVYEDGLWNRQKFCEIVNACFGTDLWCIESEAIDKIDINDDNLGEEDNESGSTDQNTK